MRALVCIMVLCVALTLNSQTTSTVSVGVRTSHNNENFFFKTPGTSIFTEAIYNNPVWLDGIHSQLTGEFIEISGIGDASLSNSIALQYRLRHFFNSRSGFFAGFGYMSGTHKQNFDVEYFNFQTENLRLQSGFFQAKRSVYDFHMGYSLHPFKNPNFVVDIGPMIQFINYQAVVAHVNQYQFEWEPQTSYWLPGVSIQTSYDFLSNSALNIGLFSEFRVVMIDKKPTPFVGLSLQMSFHHSTTKPQRDESVSILPVVADPKKQIRFLPVYLTSYQSQVGSEVISNDELSVSYSSAFIDDTVLQTNKPLDGILFLNTSEALINNVNNEIYELSYQFLDADPLAFQTSDYSVYPQFISITNLPETDNSFLVHLKSDTQTRTLIVYQDFQFESLSTYPDLERKIRNGKSKVTNGRERKERLRVKRDSLVTHYDSLEQKYRQLAYIDKILERFPPVFKERAIKALDSLEKHKKTTGTIQDQIQKIKSDVKDCEDKKNEISGLLGGKEKECEKLRKEVEEVLKALESAYFYKMGITAVITLDGNGGFRVAFRDVMLNEYDKTSSKTRDEIRKLRRELEGLVKKLKECENESEHLLSQLDAHREHCNQLNEQEKAATAMLGGASAHYNKFVQELEEICDISKRALDKVLKKWCEENPDICDFKNEINDFLDEKCPKSREEWEDFWKRFNDLLNQKIALENAIKKEMDQTEKDYDSNLAESDAADGEISDGLKEVFDAENEVTARRKAEENAAKVAAEEKRKRDEERRKQRERTKRIKDLIDKIKKGEAGEDAMKDLMILTGLGLLDEVTGNLKIGTIIGELLVVKDQPDCFCPIIIALKNAIAAANRGERIETSIYANEVIRLWKECANLPHFSSIMEGSNFLTDSIMDMTKEQKQHTIQALQSTIDANCK